MPHKEQYIVTLTRPEGVSVSEMNEYILEAVIKLDKDDLADFYDYLQEHGYETNTEIVDWRVMMWRSQGQTQWTQAYDGLTAKVKVPRDQLRVFGPDENAVKEFHNHNRKNEDDIPF